MLGLLVDTYAMKHDIGLLGHLAPTPIRVAIRVRIVFKMPLK